MIEVSTMTANIHTKTRLGRYDTGGTKCNTELTLANVWPLLRRGGSEMKKFKDIQIYGAFYLKGQLCFKLDERRYISPYGTHAIGDINMEVNIVWS